MDVIKESKYSTSFKSSSWCVIESKLITWVFQIEKVFFGAPPCEYPNKSCSDKNGV